MMVSGERSRFALCARQGTCVYPRVSWVGAELASVAHAAGAARRLSLPSRSAVNGFVFFSRSM